MKRLTAMICAVVLLVSVAVLPASAGVTDNPRVVDKADLLTDAQEAALTAKLTEYSEKNDCDIVFLTEPDMNHEDYYFNGTVEDFADMYYETHGYDADGVLVLRILDNGYGSPRIQFSCSGKCIKRLTDEEQNDIIDLAATDLIYGNYDEAFNTMADGISDKLPPRLKGYWYLLAVGIGVLLALLIMLILKKKLKTVEMQRSAANYVRSGSMHLIQSRDTYLYSTVNRVRRESNSSGGGSGRISSGGGSHSGVGRNI